MAFRVLHIGWAVVGIVVTALLATAKGHPPGLIFVPVALVIWAAGHGTLWVVRRLSQRGRGHGGDSASDDRRWPWTLVVLVFCFGALFLGGVFGLGWQLVFGRGITPALGPIVLVWVAVSAAFFGTLLRHNWARLLCGMGSLAAAIWRYG